MGGVVTGTRVMHRVIIALIGLSWVLPACGGDTAASSTHGTDAGSTSQAVATSTSGGDGSATGGNTGQASVTSTTQGSTTGQPTAGGQGGSGTDASVEGGTTIGGAAGEGASAGSGGQIDEPEPDLTSLDLAWGDCAGDGQIYCYDTNQRIQLICYDYTPAVYGVCPAGEHCDTRPDNLGQCEPILPECVGQTPYVGLCTGDTYVECGIDLLDRAYEEVCTDRCVPRADGADCIHAGCGDGTAEPTEQCDDGNNTSGDGCSAACAWDPPIGTPIEEIVGFGRGVAMSGDTIAVSGGYPDAERPEVYVYRQDGIAWRLEALLGVPGDSRATNQEAEARFLGERLALDGDTLAATGFGTEGDADEAVFIYQRSGTTWKLQAKLTPTEPDAPDALDETSSFGSGLALEGDTLVVGAAYDEEQAPFAGAAYVYRREGASWQPEQKLFATLAGGTTDAEDSAVFGTSVAISGDRITVGALGKEGATFQTGAAYVFLREGSSWTPEHRFMPPQPDPVTYDIGGPQCGSAVAIAGDTLVVGCRYDWEEVVANSGNEPSKYAGSVYVLERGTGGWAQTEKLYPLPGVHPNDDKSIAEFGKEAAISADASLVVIGSPRDFTYGAGSGSAHVFRRSGSSWITEQKLVASLPRGPSREYRAQSGCGVSLAVSGENVLVGCAAADAGGRALLYQSVDATWDVRLKLLAVEP